MDQLLTARVTKQVTVSNTTLFRVAEHELGDALQWTRIAQLNGLTDPWIVGFVTLNLPPVDPAASNGGVPNG